ncbi:hypothetical protein AVEN_236354-1 [Araneus ventricosus]|uniref:Uncharacterized protein n=1 Tax=Araneus ventricosus TaxID=182803 RepID=A0A4Y2IPL5_ARAVE|nr:hypothetical protein AVEN_236354-1 [Araneus ventricosus]
MYNKECKVSDKNGNLNQPNDFIPVMHLASERRKEVRVLYDFSLFYPVVGVSTGSPPQFCSSQSVDFVGPAFHIYASLIMERLAVGIGMVMENLCNELHSI